jgi:glycosyltransferase involved in cell wall biosynthesis
MAPRVLLVVGVNTTLPVDGPRRDWAVLAEALGADILDRSAVDRDAAARAVRRLAGLGPALAWLAFRRRHEVDVVLADGEHVAIPLAFLLRLTRARVRQVAIGHRLTSRKKRFLFRTLNVHQRIDRIALHSRAQYLFALRELGLAPDRVALVPYQVDTDFWTPRDTAQENLVVSVGLEHRDYPTLLRAAEGLDATVVIGAASSWSRHSFAATSLPPNVRVGSFGYRELRELYARAAVVVVPLRDVDNQAGVTTILEAMAMGKAVVVTQSSGQTDVVEDRRSLERGLPRARPIGLSRVLAVNRGIPVEATGFYVPPGDPESLRRAVAYLLDHPVERGRLGRAGRRLAVELFNVDEFAARIRELVWSVTEGAPRRAAARAS